jgi:hypothetical protein
MSTYQRLLDSIDKSLKGELKTAINLGAITIEKEKLISLPDYTMFVDREKYQIWKYSGTKKVMGILRDIAVRTNGTTIGKTIEISKTGINGPYSDAVVFDSTNFINLLTSSTIEQILLVPWTRNATTSRSGAQWRMVVITNKGQIYHNFPSRLTTPDGEELVGDIIKFDESVIWDLSERRYPSANIAATGTERYTPGLPAERYNYYPKLNTDATFVDTYANGGFGKSITKSEVTYPRFYQPGRTTQTNSFGFMGGFEPDNKIQIIGTYKSNSDEAVIICIFASDDGGLNWYTKYEFTRETGLPRTLIDTSNITEEYISGSFSVTKRSLISPNEINKEPSTSFAWTTPLVITSIQKGTSTVFTTNGNHSYGYGDIISIQTNVGSSPGFDWLLNK